jgi:UDP-2-acetamido-3-amino-2,3-dideoxy-glucuronate N-acetyltransferase
MTAHWPPEQMRFVHNDAFIHPKAHVDGAFIGARTKVWQFASIIRGAVVGEDCTFANGALFDGSHCGNRCIFGMNVAIGPGFLLGDDVFVGPQVTFANDRWPAANKDNFDIEFLKNGNWAIKVLDGAAIGANAVVLPGVTLGRNSMVAAGCVVTRSLPDDHCLRRDGSVVPIDPIWRTRRMRVA